MYNISNTNKITADERKKKKKPRIHLSKESLALKVFSELTDPLLGRYQLLAFLNSVLRLNSKNNYNKPQRAGIIHSWPLEVYLFLRTGL